MEITLELVERLKEKADVSYAQAKQALEYSGGNLLDALIYLEEQGAIPRQEGAYFSTKGETPPPPPEPALVPEEEPKEKRRKRDRKLGRRAKGETGDGLFTTLRRWLIDNELEIWRKGQPVTALPVLILLLLILCAYYIVLPVLALGLFLGFRYRFSGPDLEREDWNQVMGTMADTAAELGRQVMDEMKLQHDRHDRSKDNQD